MLESSFSRSYSESTKESLAITVSNTAILPPPVKTAAPEPPAKSPLKPTRPQGLLARLLSTSNLIVSGQGYPSSGMHFHLDVRVDDEAS